MPLPHPRALALAPLALLLLHAPPSGTAPARAQGGPAASQRGGVTVGPDVGLLLARAADTDGDGAVSAEERTAFEDRFAKEGTDALDLDRVLAAAIAPRLDADGDGVITAKDVAALRARLDTNGDGAVDAKERAGRPGLQALFDDIVLIAADRDQDGTVTAEEWDALGPPDLPAWLARTAAHQEDLNGFGPGVMVLTLRADLDADHDRTFRRDDLERLFAANDANGDGVLSADELRAPVAAVPDQDWSVSDEDRARPPLMPWQRSLDDALALQKETGKPLLICVNVDGETASEALAAGRYRDPQFVQLAGGFIPLLASPNRHTPRDHDDRGRRIVDPRFGRLVCSEHIDEEPLFYERYFSGQRVAPRHVGVAPDGTVLFDLYLLRDLSVIDAQLRANGVFDVDLPTVAATDEAGLLASPDATTRTLLEKRFVGSDPATRARLAGLALSDERATQHVELVRLALYDPEEAVRLAGAQALAAHPRERALELLPRARTVAADDAALRASLADAAAGLAERLPEGDARVRARRLGRVFHALELPAPGIDVALWRLALAGAPPLQAAADTGDGADLEQALETLGEMRKKRPDDPDVEGLLARTELRMALRMVRGNSSGNPGFFLQDARDAAQRALAARPDDAGARSTLAQALWWLREPQQAADEALRALPGLAAVAAAPDVGALLEVVARGRAASLRQALGSEEGWPAEWVPEAVAAYRVLLAHPGCTEDVARSAVQLLDDLEAYPEEADYLRAALRRFPASGDLHGWLRWQVLRDGADGLGGAAALEVVYDGLRAPEGMEPTWTWFEGLARLNAAERWREDTEPASAIAAYQASMDSFADSVSANPGFQDSASYYVALDWAGLARLHLDSGDLERAVDELERSFQENPDGAANVDGLGETPLQTARLLARAVATSQRPDLVARVQALAAAHDLDLGG